MSWPDLLRRRLRLTTARADTVRIDIAPRPPDEPDSVVQPLVLPVVIATDALEIGRLIIRNGVSRDGGVTADIVPVEIGPVALRGELVTGDLRFETLRAELYGLGVEATGVFGTGEPFALDAQVEWELRAWTGCTGDRQRQALRRPGEPALRAGGAAAIAGGRGRCRPAAAGPAGHLRRGPLDRPRRGRSARTPTCSSAARPGASACAAGSTITPADLAASRAPRRQADRAGRGDRWRATPARSASPGIRAGWLRRAGHRHRKHHAAGRAVRAGSGSRGSGSIPAFVDPRFAGQVDFSSEVSFDGEGNFRVVAARGARHALQPAAARVRDCGARGPGAVLRRRAGQCGRQPRRVQRQVGRQDLRTVPDRRPGTCHLVARFPRQSARHRQRVGGTTARPALDLDLTGSELATGDLRIGSLQARGGLGRPASAWRSTRRPGESRYAGQQVGNLALGVTGPLTAYSLELALTGGDVEVALAGTGSYRNGIVIQTAATGLVTILGDQRWSLREPATVRVAGQDVALTAHCWEMEDAELCLADSRLRRAGLQCRTRPAALPAGHPVPMAARRGRAGRHRHVLHDHPERAGRGHRFAGGQPRRYRRNLAGLL